MMSFRDEMFELTWQKAIQNITPVVILSEDIDLALDMAQKKAELERKKGIHRYGSDQQQLDKRFCTGIKNELVLHRKIYGNLDKFNRAIESNYRTADFYNVKIGSIDYQKLGAKAVNIGLCPMPFKNPEYPEIITIIDENLLYIMGIASVDVLKKYQHEFLVKDKNARGVKGGFYGYWALTPFPN